MGGARQRCPAFASPALALSCSSLPSPFLPDKEEQPSLPLGLSLCLGLVLG